MDVRRLVRAPNNFNRFKVGMILAVRLFSPPDSAGGSGSSTKIQRPFAQSPAMRASPILEIATPDTQHVQAASSAFRM
jgi:hypothetical protein